MVRATTCSRPSSQLLFLRFAGDNQLLVARRGGVSAMLAAMRTHASSVALQEEGCRLISNLAENGILNLPYLLDHLCHALLLLVLGFEPFPEP